MDEHLAHDAVAKLIPALDPESVDRAIRNDVSSVVRPPTSTLREVMACIDRNQRGIVLITDEHHRLLATITDGDIRRALLSGFGLSAPVGELLKKRERVHRPVTAPAGTSRRELLAIMRYTRVQQLPLLDDDGQVVSIVNLNELLAQESFPFEPNLDALMLRPDASIRRVMTAIEQTQRGIALIVDDDRRLIATLTDGDLRRALLEDPDLSAPVSDLLARRLNPRPPVTARLDTNKNDLLSIMQSRGVKQLPLLDDQGRVADIVNLSELVPEKAAPIEAVIMAGGFGTRLHPLTVDTPKPLLPVGDQSLLERLIGQLRDSGISRVRIATHYLSEKIRETIGDGRDLGVDLGYINEDQPLGTAGALGLMDRPDKPVIIINGDILTNLDFRAMFDYHQEQRADLTVATREYTINVPYGVLDSEGPLVRGLVEKPQVRYFVNAGIYLLEPWVLGGLTRGQRSDMTDLIQTLLDQGRRVANFPVMEYWIDVGSHENYLQAQRDIHNGRLKPGGNGH